MATASSSSASSRSSASDVVSSFALAGGDGPSTLLSHLGAEHSHGRGLLGFFSRRAACALALVCGELRREVAAFQKWPPAEEDLPIIARELASEDARLLARAAETLRRLTMVKGSQPSDAVVRAGVVPRLVELLARDATPRLQCDAAWSLSNIASFTSDNKATVINAGAVPALVRLLGSPDADVHAQAVWALGNIAADIVLPIIARELASEDARLLARTADMLRRLLSFDRSPALDATVRAGVLPRLVELLARDATPRLQLEAAWALTNIAGGTSANTESVINAGAVPALVRLLDSPDADVREQAVWALGNIAGGSVRTRDVVIAAGVIPPLLRCLAPHSKDSCIRNTAWAISNLCRGKPLPAPAVVAPLLPMLSALITSTDSEVLTDSLWALSYLTDGDESRRQAFLEAGAISRVVALLDHASLMVVTPALRTIGYVDTGDDLQKQIALSEGALVPVARLLLHPRENIRKEACWLVSNVCSGTVPQIEAVINANIVPLLITLMSHGEADVSREACWALSNATAGGSADQIARLVNYGIIPPLKEMLTRADPRAHDVAIEGLVNILWDLPPPSPTAPTSYRQRMVDAGVPAALEDLVASVHTPQLVLDKAKALLAANFADSPLA